MNKEFKYYTLLKFIPIFNFFEPIENQDLRYILKLEDYSELPDISELLLIELSQVYENLSNDYSEKSIDVSDPLFDCKKSIVTLTNKKNIINFTVELLRYKYSGVEFDCEYFETKLRNAGYKLDYSNEHEFYNSLDNIVNASKGIDYRIKLREDEIKKLTKDNKNNNYLESIIAIEEGIGIKLNIYKDTMTYFISCRDRLEKKAEAMKKNKQA